MMPHRLPAGWGGCLPLLLCVLSALFPLSCKGSVLPPESLQRRSLLSFPLSSLLSAPSLIRARQEYPATTCTSLDGPMGCSESLASLPTSPRPQAGSGDLLSSLLLTPHVRIHVRERPSGQSLLELLSSVLEDDLLTEKRKSRSAATTDDATGRATPETYVVPHIGVCSRA